MEDGLLVNVCRTIVCEDGGERRTIVCEDGGENGKEWWKDQERNKRW